MPSRVDGKALSWGPFQERHASPDEIALWCRDASTANVACALGIASGHTFAVDIDCLNEDVSKRVQELALQHLGATPLVRIGRAPKAALFYRYDEMGSPHSRAVQFAEHPDCALEILGAGRAITLHGLHHVTGRWFQWPQLNPLISPPEVAPEVSAHRVDLFVEAVQREFPFKSNAFAARGAPVDWATVSTDGIIVPVTKVDSKLSDGREAFLTKLAFNTVRRNGTMLMSAHEQGAIETAMAQVTAAVVTEFEANCELSGVWLNGGLGREAASKVGRTVHKLVAGDIKPWLEKATKSDRPKSEDIPDDGRPVVRVVAGQMKATVDAAEDALVAAGGIYQRGEAIVRVGSAPVRNSDGETRNVRRIRDMSELALGEALGVVAHWTKWDARRDADVACEPPTNVVGTLMSRVGFWRLPVLSGVASSPTMRFDGTIAQEPGYDERTGIIFEMDGGWGVPETPSRDDALAAMSLLKGLVATFPFVDDAARSVALSTFLTACIRRTLPTAPLHAFSAPTAGSGKSKLADIAALLVTGSRAPVLAIGDGEAETEKRLGSALLAGDPVIAIDNVPEGVALGGDLLCQALTQESVRVRILGQSSTPELPTGSLFTATGNSLQVLGDMTRRTLLCRIDPGVERPETRVFDNDPVDVVARDRKPYVVACLTVLRAFEVAGKPRQASRLGSFEAWSSRVRDALIWLGEADPVATMEVARASDPRLAAATSMLTMWHAVVGDVRLSLKEVIDAAIKKGADFDFINPDLREALLVVAAEGGAISSRRLGKYVGGVEGRIVGGLKLSKDGQRAGVQLWRVEKVS